MRRLFTPQIVIGTVVGLSLGWLAAGQMTWAQDSLHPLVGTWNVIFTPDSLSPRTREFKDIITILPDDKFISETMKKKGFAEGKVDEATTRFGPCKWKVTLKHDDNGKETKAGSIHYQGTADGNEMQGTMTWTQANGDKTEYKFRGEPKR